MDKVLQARFGQSPRLELQHGDWLQRGMSAKTVKFDIGHGGLPPDVTWEDRCAAIASIDDKPAKALASILVWGTDSNWDWSESFNTVVAYLADEMLKQCAEDGRKAPRGCLHTLPELARLMARMVLYFELYELWDLYTVKGRLAFSGIDIKHNTYNQLWVKYQHKIHMDIDNIMGNIDFAVSRYRRQLQ